MMGPLVFDWKLSSPLLLGKTWTLPKIRGQKMGGSMVLRVRKIFKGKKKQISSLVLGTKELFMISEVERNDVQQKSF